MKSYEDNMIQFISVFFTSYYCLYYCALTLFHMYLA